MVCVQLDPKALFDIHMPAVVPTANIVPVLLIAAHLIVDGVIAADLAQIPALNDDVLFAEMYNWVVDAAKAYWPFTFMAKQVQFWFPSTKG